MRKKLQIFAGSRRKPVEVVEPPEIKGVKNTPTPSLRQNRKWPRSLIRPRPDPILEGTLGEQDGTRTGRDGPRSGTWM